MMHRWHLPRPALCKIPSDLTPVVINRHNSNAEKSLPLSPRDVQTYVPWDVSCCLRPLVRGGVCAGEVLLAGNRVVDAFGCDVRTFVWKASGAP